MVSSSYRPLKYLHYIQNKLFVSIILHVHFDDCFGYVNIRYNLK